MASFSLNPIEYQKLLDAERELHDLMPEMDKFEECGGECQEYRRVLRDELERIEKIKLHYAPKLTK